MSSSKLTRAQKKQLCEHVMLNVLDQEPKDPLHLALSAAFVNPSVALIISMSDNDISALKCTDKTDPNNPVVKDVSRSDKALVRILGAFSACRSALGQPIEHADWNKITVNTLMLSERVPTGRQ